MFQKIGITTRQEVLYQKILEDIISFLIKNNKDVRLSTYAIKILPEKFLNLKTINYNEKLDLLIVYGGDGTMLRAVRNIKHESTYILGINSGHLGFLSSMDIHNWQKKITEIFTGNYTIMPKNLFQVEVYRAGEKILNSKILNEVVVSYKNIARLIHTDVSVGNKKVCKYSSDGLIVASPTGSTAYNLSAGGPIVHPSVEGVIITPICSHSLTQKPVVVPAKKKITLKFKNNENNLNLTLDGYKSFAINNNDKVTVSIINNPLLFIRQKGDSYFKILKKKLHWGKSLRL